ncbi:RND family transporter [Schlesneria sp. T3-172]|uniref:efflux RND transporter permease subunit n=1 Tax=Schlesneria sphaerica TaxID=3373610 RepID=UPI0037C93904
MAHFFEKRDFWGNRLSMWLVVLMAFAAPVCWWSVRQLHLDNEVEKWLPNEHPELRALRWTHEEFPIEERILLTWEGSSINDPRLERLVDQLLGKPDAQGTKRGGLPYVSSVLDPRAALNVMQENGISAQDAARRLEGTLLGVGPLRLRLTEVGRSAIKKTRRELQLATRSKFGLELVIHEADPDLSPLVAIPGPVAEEGGTSEPTQPVVVAVDGTPLEEATVDHDLKISWKGIRIGSPETADIANWLKQYVPEWGEGSALVEDSFFVLGSPVALAVGISEAGLADKAETIASIRAICDVAGIPAGTLHMTGSIISANELNSEVRKAIWNTSYPLIQFHRRSVLLSSALFSALMAYVLVRNVRLASMILFVAMFTAFGALALISFTGGSMNMILSVMPTLLIVLTLSGAIHVVNYWKHAASADESSAIVESIRSAWSPCSLASLTTAIGLISLSTSELSPVREFGLYAACGTMFSLLMIIYGLPALMQMWAGPIPREKPSDQGGWRFFGRIVTVHPGLQSLLVIAVAVALSWGISKMQTETKVIRYFPEKSQIAQDYWFIETNLGGVMPVETVIRFDEQAQRDSTFLDRMELVRQIQEKMWSHPEISGSVSLADFQPVSEQPPEDASFIVRTKHQKRATIIQQRIRDGEIPGARSFYSVAEQSHDLHQPGDHRLNQAGDELWRITAQVNVMTENSFEKILADLHQMAQEVLKLQAGSHHLITGKVPLFVQTQHAVLESLISSFGLAFALIFVVFTITLRSFPAALIAMIPNLLPITVVFGAASWMGQRIDIGSMITASIALGIAVDGTLHYLAWFKRAMSDGSRRRDAAIHAMVHSGPALLQTSAAVGFGLLLLVPAELTLISRFGSLMASMIGVALLGDLVLLPQLVSGPFGRFFEPKQAASASGVSSAELPVIVPVAEAEPVARGVAVPKPHHHPVDPKRKKGRPTA